DELSVGAARVGTVRGWIRALDHGEAVELAQRALDAGDASSVEALARPLAPAGRGARPRPQPRACVCYGGASSEERRCQFGGTAVPVRRNGSDEGGAPSREALSLGFQRR